MSDILIKPSVTDPETQNEDPIETHVVGPIYNDDGTVTSGATRITEAVVTGTPVEALCGYVWIPSRNPEHHPLCQRCEEIIKAGDRH